MRNHLLVMATCDCAYEEAKKMAAQIPGAVAVGQFHGCGADPMVVRTLIGVASNPNVGAVLLVGLGCETITVDLLADGLEGEPGIRASGKPLAEVVIQRDGGSLQAIEKQHIALMLDYFKGNKQKSSTALGISRSTLYEKMKTYSLSSP